MPPAERQNRVEAAFLAALECDDPEARDRLVVERCAGDAEALAEVRSLLKGHDQARGVLEHRSLVEPASLGLGGLPTSLRIGDEPALPPGTRIAGYTLTRLLGAGGMGVVYVADQERPRRTVALKLIRSAGAAPSLLRRFEAEADILGRLQHPGIAQIFEAGTASPVVPDATGLPRPAQPFLAMELVNGPTISAFAEQQALSTDLRLELVARICDAVQHAHQRGVIHRDLKPSNILMDTRGPQPQPKVLDFGVARVTDADIRVTTLQTGVGQLIGTLP